MTLKKDAMMVENATSVPGAGHGLLCPACRVDLIMSDRQGIEIDYCPKCRGVWLDRGELDKIIEKSAADDQRGAGTQAAPPPPQPYPPQVYSERGYGHHGRGHHGSFLKRLFD